MHLMDPRSESAWQWPKLPLGAVLVGSTTAVRAESQLWRTGVVTFMAARVVGRKRRLALNGRGKLCYVTGSIRQRRNRNGGVRGLLSSACERLWRALIATPPDPRLWPQRSTAEVAEAFQAGDFTRLHFALGLKPWHPSPLTVGDQPPRDDSPWEQSRPMVQDLRRAILEAMHRRA
jgi:hypothetical protein